MDLDRFIVRNAGAWHRLEDLTSRARRSGPRAMSPSEVDELVALYQRTSAQLSHARTYYDDPGLTSRLTTLVAAANAAIYGAPPASLRSFGRFFSETFPAAVYVTRRFIGAAAGVFIHANEAGQFFGLILPHGLLELSAIVFAGGAGLRIGWTVIAPGDRPRGTVLAEEGRRAVVIVLGLMLCFIVAGIIEG